VCSIWDGIDCGHSTDDERITVGPGPRVSKWNQVESSKSHGINAKRQTETESDSWDMI
jgi:hypothetical protein